MLRTLKSHWWITDSAKARPKCTIERAETHDFRMNDPSKRFGGAGALFHLFSFGLVAAGTAISFGLASFSLAGISRETRIGGSETKFICLHSAAAPYPEGHAPIKIEPPSLSDATTSFALLSLVQHPTTSDLRSQEPGPRSNFGVVARRPKRVQQRRIPRMPPLHSGQSVIKRSRLSSMRHSKRSLRQRRRQKRPQ